jgi:nucleotide-binding universal stress UspA family protein
MDAKSILLVIGTAKADADLQKAIAIGIEENAHLSVLVSAIAMPPSVGDYPVGEVWLGRREKEMAAIEAQVLASREQCAASGLSFDVDSFYPERAWSDAAMAERARYVDLVLVGGSAFQDLDLKQSVVGGAVIDSGRPAMIFPDDGLPTLRPRRVLLAWDRSVSAGRAARAALKTLVAADTVRLVMVDPVPPRGKDREQPGADMAAYLARHGVRVEIDEIASGGHTVEEVLLRHALDVGADLLVIGAYGHTRLRERVFGGVTKSMLDTRRISMLMAH